MLKTYTSHNEGSVGIQEISSKTAISVIFLFWFAYDAALFFLTEKEKGKINAKALKP